MLHLCNVLQLIVDGFNDGTFPCQQPVRHAHDGSLHVALQFRYQLDSVNEQPLEELLADVSLVTDELAVEELHESLVVKRLAVINVAGGDHEIKELALLVADEVKLESEEPAHRALAPLGDAFESLVNMDALILAHPEWCAVHKTDAGAFAQKHLLDEKGQRNCDVLLQLHEAVVGHHLGEQVAELSAHVLQIKMLQAPVAGIVEQDHDDHHFRLGKSAVPVIFTLLLLLYRVFCHHCIKKLAKIICHTENFSNFVLGKH